MIGPLLLGAAAGFVAALLFAAVGTGSVSAVVLMYLAPLPILIVGLGWHHLLALLALSVGGAAASLMLRPSAGIAFALGPALAAWALSWLVTVGPYRLAGRFGVTSAGAFAGMLLLATGCFGAVMAFSALGAATGFDHATYLQALNGAASAILRREYGDDVKPASDTGRDVVRLVVAFAPALLAALLTLILALNLWLAGKVVAISGRLSTSLPEVPTARMPVGAIGAFCAGLVLAALPGFAGIAGTALVGGLGMAFALQGLALMHFVSRGRPGRSLLLSVAYLLTLLLGYALLPLFALLGLADSASPRLRGFRPPPSPPPRS